MDARWAVGSENKRMTDAGCETLKPLATELPGRPEHVAVPRVQRIPCDLPRGQTIGLDENAINLYHGTADSRIAFATGSVRALPYWMDGNSSTGIASGA